MRAAGREDAGKEPQRSHQQAAGELPGVNKPASSPSSSSAEGRQEGTAPSQAHLLHTLVLLYSDATTLSSAPALWGTPLESSSSLPCSLFGSRKAGKEAEVERWNLGVLLQEEQAVSSQASPNPQHR